MSRRLKISIFRHNPRDPRSVPRTVEYELDEQPGMTLFIALNAIRVILNAVHYPGRSEDVDFVPDPAIVVPAAQELALMEADRIRSGKFTG